ncbi:nuclear transport factor 2 family protein [Chitinophagaceae bacterium LWZ2-11]
MREKILLLLFLLCASASMVSAQKNTNDSAHQVLYKKIAEVDSLLFKAFNKHDLGAMKKYFADNVEFYHDKGGFTEYKQTMENFTNMFANNPAVRRELLKESLEVYPIKDYGAIEVGLHKFCNVENGKEACGIYKFLMIWQFKDGEWKMTRIVSYDH